jgi:DNA-binding ferritin-like protein
MMHQDPYAEGIQVVWHDPTSYDPTKHAPPYMPEPGVRLSSEQRILAKKVAASSIHPKVAHSLFPELPPLSALLAVLRAAAFIHQTHHWQTRGAAFYADHLLFERLYNESQAFIDQVAERAVGLQHAGVVDAHAQVTVMGHLIETLCEGSLDPDRMIEISLNTESLVVQTVGVALSKLKASEGGLTNGTDNLLQGVADLHETFVYLLRQRLPLQPKYSYYGR